MANDRLTFTDTAGPRCGLRVQVGSSAFICRAPQGHPSDPTKGIAGSGHNFIGVGTRDA